MMVATKKLGTIAKLLRQAEDADHAGRAEEAEAFQRKAFGLMAQHGVTEALARARIDGLDIETDAEAQSVTVRLRGRYIDAQISLLLQTAAAIQCAGIISYHGGRPDGTVMIYGMADHLRRVAQMWTMLAPQAQRGMESAHPGPGSAPSTVARYRRSWVDGYAAAVVARIRQAEDAAAASAGAVELYRTDRHRADDAMKAAHPDMFYRHSRRDIDWGAWQLGEVSGNAARLQQEVSG